MVKTLHPIEEIATDVFAADEHRVRLIRASGEATHVDDRPQDAAQAVVRALAEPLEYPPLAAGIVPGDRVAIAFDGSVPCLGDVVLGAVEAIQQAGVEPDAISIVATHSDTLQICREAFREGLSKELRFVLHDPDDEDSLCLVGVTQQGERLTVNRTIFDADIVLPIGCARVHGMGAYDSLFPRFSSAESIGRHRMPLNSSSAQGQAERMHEADEAGWLIGAPIVVQVVPGAGETVAHVVAGDPSAVARRCEELCLRRWAMHSPQLVDLVVATITGGPESQTWDNVGRAIASTEHLLSEHGALAICTNLDEPPGKSLGRLIGVADFEMAEQKIGRDQGSDSWTAWHLARALQRGPVYLLSQLPAETVEDLGVAPIADISELARLAGRHESFVLLEDSQHAVATVEIDEQT